MPVSLDAIVSASKSFRECLEDVKTRVLVDHMTAKEKNYFAELKNELKSCLQL